MKNIAKKMLEFLLTICITMTLLPIGTSAANTYNGSKALAYAKAHWSDGNELCAGFVSNCLKAGGLSSWDRECTNLYNQLNKEVVNDAKIASIQYLKASGNYIKTADNKGKVSKGDVLFWLCAGCPSDTVGGPYQHTALVSDVSGTYVNVYQHNGAVNNQPAYVGTCYECGRRYSDMVVVHFNSTSSAPKVMEYFDCDVQINTSKGKRINLYNKPTDSSPRTWFDQGQIAYSTRAAKLSDGSTWYEIQAVDNGKVVTLWLNAKSSGVKVINNKTASSITFSSDSVAINPGESKTISIKFTGNDVKSMGGSIDGQSFCDVKWGNTNWSAGTTSLIITGKKSGTATISINLMDKNGTIICSKNLSVKISESQTSQISEGVYVIQAGIGNNMVLDCEKGRQTAGSIILLWDRHDAENQQICVVPLDNGNYALQLVHSGQVLDVEKASKKSGAQVIQYNWNGGANQQWKLVPAGDGYYYIVSALSGMTLDVSGGRANAGSSIIVYQPHYGDNQKFKFLPVK